MNQFSRFLFSHCSHLSKDKKKVTARAFIPPEDGKLSILGEDGLELKRIWEIGLCVEKKRKNQPLLGKGGFIEQLASSLGLTFEQEDSDCFNHSEHWHLIGWRIDDRTWMKETTVALAETASEALELYES
jgi:hypothetical protein